MIQKRTKLIAISDDVFSGGKDCWLFALRKAPDGGSEFKKGWETWVHAEKLHEQMEDGDNEIMPEDNKYSINFKLSAFKIVSQ